MYRINISEEGRHVFATEIEDLTDARRVYQLLRLALPRFKIDVTEWQNRGTEQTAQFEAFFTLD